MKNIIFMGYVVSPEEADHMSGASVAGNKMQWNVIKNLQCMSDINLLSVTVTPLAVFPLEKQKRQKRQIVPLTCGVTSVRVSYCNLPILKQLTQIINVYRETKALVEKNKVDTLLAFNQFPQMGIPMRWLKKKYPYLDTVCLLADLPMDANTQRKGFSAVLRRIFDGSAWKSMRRCDRFIVLNPYVAKQYLPGKPYLVIDGGVDDAVLEQYRVPAKKEAGRHILFSGALTAYNGILPLIQAMQWVTDPQICLDIYGGGYLEEEVKHAAQQNARVHFYGKVSNQTVLQRQREAWLLINPRTVDDAISRTTFPSKTFEYLLSGTPVLTTPLETYGPEYNDKMYFSTGDTPQELAQAINHLCEKTPQELDEMCRKAAHFVSTEKTWSRQCKRIADFLCEKV